MTYDMDAANQQTVIYTAEVRPNQDRFGGLVPEGVRLIYAMICEALHIDDDPDSVGLSYGQYDCLSHCIRCSCIVVKLLNGSRF